MLSSRRQTNSPQCSSTSKVSMAGKRLQGFSGARRAEESNLARSSTSPDQLFSNSVSVESKLDNTSLLCRAHRCSPASEPVKDHDHLQQKAKLFADALAQESRRTEKLQRECERLAREKDRLREEMKAVLGELAEVRVQKDSLEARNIELSKQLQATPAPLDSKPDHSLDSMYYLLSRECRASEDEVSEVLRYLNFLVERLEATSDLRALYRGRVATTTELKVAVSEGNWAFVALRLTQVLSDFVVFYEDQGNRAQVKEDTEVVKLAHAQGTQTTSDRSVVTERVVSHLHSPSITSSSLESASKSVFYLPPPQQEDRLKSNSPAFGQKLDVHREDHRTLLSTLNTQSSQLSRLNKQLAAATSLHLQQDRHSSINSFSTPKQRKTEFATETSKDSEPSPNSSTRKSPRSPSSKKVKTKFPLSTGKPVVSHKPAHRSRPPGGIMKSTEAWSSVSDFFSMGETQ